VLLPPTVPVESPVTPPTPDKPIRSKNQSGAAASKSCIRLSNIYSKPAQELDMPFIKPCSMSLPKLKNTEEGEAIPNTLLNDVIIIN
jgi:hypothetical protein